MSEYIEPTSEDIEYLKDAQKYEKWITKDYKEQRFSTIGFYSSLVIFLIGCIGLVSKDKTLDIFLGFGFIGLVFFGMFYYSYVRGQGKENTQRNFRMIQDCLKNVECKWTMKDSRYYVYLKDGRKIEVDEY